LPGRVPDLRKQVQNLAAGLRVGTTEEPKFEPKRFVWKGSVSKKSSLAFLKLLSRKVFLSE
jgi:hypothetical protein